MEKGGRESEIGGYEKGESETHVYMHCFLNNHFYSSKVSVCV